MPRRRAAPRLYLDTKRKQWVIRDGARFVRTGCVEADRAKAEKRLAEYLGEKHQPERGPDPLIADVLLVYAQEHVPHLAGTRNTGYNLESLAAWWGTKTVGDITPRTCREYAASRSHGATRRDLEVLRAAISYYHREWAPLPVLPSVVLPAKGEPRERWLTRSEAARLLWAARRVEHLKRFILIGLYTGSRSRNIFQLRWEQIDFNAGVMRRRALGEREKSTKRAPPVRLARRFLAHLRRWRARDGVVRGPVVHYDGKPIKKFRWSWPQAVQRAGLVDVSPHTLRHTRATWLMQEGVSVWEAAGHLGMTVETLTRVYGKHSPDFQKTAAEV